MSCASTKQLIWIDTLLKILFAEIGYRISGQAHSIIGKTVGFFFIIWSSCGFALPFFQFDGPSLTVADLWVVHSPSPFLGSPIRPTTYCLLGSPLGSDPPLNKAIAAVLVSTICSCLFCCPYALLPHKFT